MRKQATAAELAGEAETAEIARRRWVNINSLRPFCCARAAQFENANRVSVDDERKKKQEKARHEAQAKVRDGSYVSG